MTRILLIRHGNTDLVNRKLCGRLPGIPLNAEGLMQSQAMAKSLRGRVTLQAVYSSPLQRATETAAPIAELQGSSVNIDERLNELEFGEWTGLPFQQLQGFDSWRRYNSNRSLNGPPGGESLLQVQSRAWESLSEITARQNEKTVAIVTHADVIRVLLVLFLGMPLDFLLRLEIGPASISEVTLGGGYPLVSSINVLLPTN